MQRDPQNGFHKASLAIALIVGGVTAILQPLSGDLLAKSVAKTQPVKLAAFEGQFETETGASFRIGGIPDESAGVTRYAIEIPYGLSILAYGDPNATVKGLNDFPADVRPPVAIVHICVSDHGGMRRRDDADRTLDSSAPSSSARYFYSPLTTTYFASSSED